MNHYSNILDAASDNGVLAYVAVHNSDLYHEIIDPDSDMHPATFEYLMISFIGEALMDGGDKGGITIYGFDDKNRRDELKYFNMDTLIKTAPGKIVKEITSVLERYLDL